MNKKTLVEIVGWYGTVAIVLAYALSSFSILKPTGLIYQFLNLSGALGIVVISFRKKAYQPGVLNVIWSMIAFVAIIKLILLH